MGDERLLALLHCFLIHAHALVLGQQALFRPWPEMCAPAICTLRLGAGIHAELNIGAIGIGVVLGALQLNLGGKKAFFCQAGLYVVGRLVQSGAVVGFAVANGCPANPRQQRSEAMLQIRGLQLAAGRRCR